MNTEKLYNSFSDGYSTVIKSHYYVPYSADLLHFLSQGYQIKNAKHANRLFAFNDLIRRCYFKDTQLSADNSCASKHTSTNIKALSGAWGWSRPATAQFLSKLEELGVITVSTEGCNRVVSLCSFVPLPYPISSEVSETSENVAKMRSDSLYELCVSSRDNDFPNEKKLP